ncbi:TPA: hypothetical protein ACXNQV_000338 [Stenotrophomonas maltophilia]|uniref:hypothetical protein n=1 Tax=Stenotrophomonas maltophilia TaxID=40324 RepID=UPI0015EBDC4D|nr:hypothetical protein [Stenotrophomonas maltophilia]
MTGCKRISAPELYQPGVELPRDERGSVPNHWVIRTSSAGESSGQRHRTAESTSARELLEQK